MSKATSCYVKRLDVPQYVVAYYDIMFYALSPSRDMSWHVTFFDVTHCNVKCDAVTLERAWETKRPSGGVIRRVDDAERSL